jgi:HlyD family secretion protein
MKRFLIILVILIVLAGGGWYGYQQYLRPAEPRSLRDDPRVQPIAIERETLVDTISASGSIEPEAEVEMKFETGGTVEEVLVKKGQYVTAGTVLARLDTADLELQVRSAEIDLAQAQANLEQLFEPELVEEITAAQASVESARLNLVELQEGPDPDDITKAESALKQAEIILKDAQWAYDQVAFRGDVGSRSQANELQDATLAYESALADYNLALKEATPAELASARSSVANAQSSLAQLLREPSRAEIASQQANVDKAQLSLEEARKNLDNAVLVAPTAGIVLVVNIEPGERVLDDADEAAMTIANTSTYLLKMEVDELDIGQVRQGQRAIVTLDAFADQDFEGTVTDISPSPVASEGEDSIVTYEVTITLDTDGQSIGLLSGMTANANIETRELKDALVVPNRAIQTEQGRGGAITYVEKLDEAGNLSRVEIKTGMRSGSVTEVVAGLEEGDQVIIRQQAQTGSASGL